MAPPPPIRYPRPMPPLVTTAWLADHLDQVRTVDATLLDPALGRDARAEYDAAHIPGAIHLDLATLRDAASPLPNTLPPADLVADRLSTLGLDGSAPIVLYDDGPWRTAARAWWLLKTHGIGDVAILDGGLGKWRAEGRPLTTVAPDVRPAAVKPDLNPARLRTLDQMRGNLVSNAEQVLDARSPARFSGAEADPHGAAPGHIPGSRNLHYARLFAPDGTYKPVRDLRAEFDGVDLDSPVVATCGSGVTAATIAFALHLLGREAAVYDGSWSEWGGREDTSKATA